jgi:hypothetical protein
MLDGIIANAMSGGGQDDAAPADEFDQQSALQQQRDRLAAFKEQSIQNVRATPAEFARQAREAALPGHQTESEISTSDRY